MEQDNGFDWGGMVGLLIGFALFVPVLLAIIRGWRRSNETWALAGIEGQKVWLVYAVFLNCLCGAGVIVAIVYFVSWEPRLKRAEAGQASAPLGNQVGFAPTLRRVNTEIDNNLAAGNRVFTVLVRESELDVLTRLDTFVDLLTKRIAGRGDVRVSRVDMEGWGGVATLHIEAI